MVTGNTPEERQADFRQKMAACCEIVKDVRKGRKEEEIEQRAIPTGFDLCTFLRMAEYEESQLIKDKNKKRPVFTRRALAAKADSDKKKEKEAKELSNWLRDQGVSLALERRVWGDGEFIKSYAKEHYPDPKGPPDKRTG